MPVLVSCSNCQTEFERRPSRVKESGDNFCSVSCRREYQQTLKVTLTCANCDSEFRRLESQLHHSENAYCTKQCRNEHYEKKRVSTSCDYCGEKYEIQPSKLENGEGKFCSYECYGQYRIDNRPTRPCSNCGVEVSRQAADLERVEKAFCSTNCHTEYLIEQSQGKEPEAVHYGPDWKEIREEVRDRDEWTCQGCGKTEEDLGYTLHVHHIIPFEQHESPTRANRKNNLVSLCARCHADWEGVPLRPQTV